jgi:hypothetical protein
MLRLPDLSAVGDDLYDELGQDGVNTQAKSIKTVLNVVPRNEEQRRIFLVLSIL